MVHGMNLDPVSRAIAEGFAESGMTQSEFSATVNVAQTTASRWISGASRPRRDMWPLIDRALGLPPNTLARAAGYVVAADDDLESRVSKVERDLHTIKRLIGIRLGIGDEQ